jgi:toxin ParE1/3/4
MTRQVVKKPRALQDLIEQFAYIAGDNVAAAQRFLEAAEATFHMLAQMPGAGRVRRYADARLAGLRSRSVRGFRNYLVFYRPTKTGIEVVRVLHGARDIDAILRSEEL